MKTKTIIIIVVVALLVAGVIWYLTKGKDLLMSTEQKRAALLSILTERELQNGDNFDMLTEAEVNTAYDFVFNYVRKNKTPDAVLSGKVNQLTQKYNIFS